MPNDGSGRRVPAFSGRAGVAGGVTAGAVAAAALAGLGVWGASTLDAHTTTVQSATLAPARAIPGLAIGVASVSPRASIAGRPPDSTTAVVPGHRVAGAVARASCTGCTTVFSVPLAHGAHLDGVEFDTTPATGWLDYYANGWLVARSGMSEAQQQPGDWDVPQRAACQVADHAQRCVVGYDSGAHRFGVVLLTVGPRTGIRITDRVVGTGAAARLTDLNGDGITDAAILDRPPGRARGPMWHTYLQRGGKLVSTGCSAPDAAPPRHVQTGPCAD